MKTTRMLASICLAAVLAACSASDILLAVAGKYLFSEMTLTTNNCKADAAVTLAGGTDVVNQDGHSVSLNTDGKLILGSVDPDNRGFTITYTQVVDSINVKVAFSFRVMTSNNLFALTITTTAGDCVLVYSGTASKI
jgi:hypothetical protein